MVVRRYSLPDGTGCFLAETTQQFLLRRLKGMKRRFGLKEEEEEPIPDDGQERFAVGLRTITTKRALIPIKRPQQIKRLCKC